ncbi:MAG: hypothetical protein P4L59_19005 [Desulfosporosinus sp.]|nr:hypothetical protein [Desulfosporosinus sp.]
MAARFVDPALWNKAVQDEGEDNLDQFYLFGGMGINSLSVYDVWKQGNITAVKAMELVDMKAKG